jgi:hypothetical protein
MALSEMTLVISVSDVTFIYCQDLCKRDTAESTHILRIHLVRQNVRPERPKMALSTIRDDLGTRWVKGHKKRPLLR